MIKVNAGQGKSALEISIVVGRIIGEIEDSVHVIAKTNRAGCPAKDVGVEANAILCRRSDICGVRDVELGGPNKHWKFILHSRHGVVECF